MRTTMSQDNAKLAEAISLPDAPTIVILPSVASPNYFAPGPGFIESDLFLNECPAAWCGWDGLMQFDFGIVVNFHALQKVLNLFQALSSFNPLL